MTGRKGPPAGRCGLLGGSLAHSFSPLIHRELGDYGYRLFALPEEAVPGFLARGEFDALNVTIPYKQLVIPYCSTLSPAARRIGSVNTLLRDGAGRLHGFNTDYGGFAGLAAAAGIAFSGRRVLVLGSGGTSRTVQAVARDGGAAEVVVVSRTGPENYGNLARHADAEIVVNTTPVGMFPDAAGRPVDLAGFPCCRGVLDVVYNPLRTRLLLQAEERRIPCAGGLRMLVAQAAASAELFLGRPLPLGAAEAALAKLRRRLANLVLVGMPGCGKTVLGRAIARRLGRPFVDIDAAVVAEQGRPVAAIFVEDGEAAFRALEAEMVRRVGLRNGQVVATGGGAVLSEENRLALRGNGFVVQVRRPLARLETGNGRPLSGDAAALAKLHRERRGAYEAAADCSVDNDGSVEDCVRKVEAIFSGGEVLR